MRKNLLKLMLLLMAIALGTQLSAQSVATSSEKKVVRVKLQREVADRLLRAPMTMSNGVVTTGITQLDRANRKVKAVSIRRLIPYSPKFEARHKAAGLDLWYEITFDPNAATPTSARTLYKTVPGVQIAEEVRPMKLIGNGPVHLVNANSLPTRASSADMPFNDPMLSQQWHYHNDGSLLGSVAGADINAFEAWKEETGKSDVLVAIIDGGYQTDHPDLAQNVWTNEAEANGQPGVDDDGNGYTDDVYGWNFVFNSSEIHAHDHGTHVAGTVAAVNGNGIGVCGVAGGQNGQGGVKIMSAQVFDSRSTNINADFAAAIVYAADMGASIAQCSWGWNEAGYYEQAVLDAIDYFTQYGGGEKMNGGLCIFANGNTGENAVYYPGAYEPCVAVGAMDPMLQATPYSTRGDWCDVTAPGGNVDYGDSFGVLSTLPNGQYGFMDGTSMACPHVSGIAALVLSKYGNSEFPNSTLRQQLVSSVNDLYTRNPDVVGLFGSGYIDAWKALQVGSGAPPQSVSEFTLTPSQDNILIEWQIPQAEEGSVDHHVIYYSTSAFNAQTDLSTLRSVTLDTKFYTSGDSISYELGGLQPLTTYYVAIVAVNRYGNAAAMSPVQSATTNEGPEVSFDKTTLSLNVDASKGAVGQDQLTINNVGKGMLEYSLSASTVSASLTTMANEKPVPGRLVPAKKGVEAYAAVSGYPVVTADYMQEDFPKEITYSEGILYYIGDSNRENPNALAQYFYVDPTLYPNGFNLTALRMGGSGNSYHPVIEIYGGSQSISTSTLIERVEYDFFSYNYDINLQEQIFFAPGSSFWIVAKYPAGETNPLGAGHINTESVSQYSFYSLDNGETWTLLSEVLSEGNLADEAGNLTWDVYAISKNPDWSSVLSPEPISGTVRPGESQVVTMKNDGQSMPNGNYTFRLKVNTNQPDKPEQKLTVNMAVSGNKPELSTAKVVDFGELLVGQEKSLAVEVVNNGYGAFTGEGGYSLSSSNISCSSDEFEPDTYISGGFAARAKSTFDVTFRPTSAGSKSGTITFTDKNGVKYSFVVRGVASMPAKAEVSPLEINFGTLGMESGAETDTIVIKNSGQYPLEYVFPRFSDETIDGAEAHKFGYSYESNLNGDDSFQYDGNPDLLNETDITSQFNEYTWQSEAVDLGFQFPFYGNNYNKVYVNSHGGVAFNKIDGNITCMVPEASCVEGLGYISAYACSGKLKFGAQSKVTYGRQDGKFTIKYKDVLAPALNGGDEYTPISFHMSLCADGSIEVYYDDYDTTNQFNEGRNVFIGVADSLCEDPFVVTDVEATRDGSTIYQQITAGTAVRIIAPTVSMVESLSSTSGVIGIGEKAEIIVNAKAVDGMYAGDMTNNLTILTNDPSTPSVNVVLKAVITGDNLAPEARLDTLAVNFGEVFRTSEAVRSVLLSNNGTDNLVVSSVTVVGGKFTVPDDVAKGFTVRPGYGKDIFVTLPTAKEGTVTDRMVIKYADGTSETVELSGTVIGCPAISVTPETVNIDTPYGTNAAENLTVSNSGDETLTFSVEPNDWFTLTNLDADANSSVGYQFKSKTDYDEIKYDWVDITDNADAHQDYSYYVDKTDFYEVELPFEFPFYGKKYKTMYIYNTGFVSFSEQIDYKEFPAPPATFPSTETLYKNLIAPFWGNHTMDAASSAGTYYKAEGDHVVVSFINYGNSAMMGMDFQVLLYKDGSYKFQYHLEPGGMIIGIYGVAGMQNEAGDEGINLPEQCIADGNAVEFYPVKTFNVAAGTEVQMPIEVKADSLGGEYTSNIVLNTNVPSKEVYSVPMNINIQGEPQPVIPESVKLEEVADFVTYVPHIVEFNVANTGSKAFKITGVTYNDPSYMTNLQVYATYFDWLFGTEVTGWTSWQPGMELEVGLEPAQFRLIVNEMGTPAEYNAPITMTFDGLDVTEKEIPVDIRLTEAPVLAVSPAEGVTVSGVESDYKDTLKVEISNTGKYKMTYSLRMDPTGVGETESQTPGAEPGLPGIMFGRNMTTLSKAQIDTIIKRTSRAIEPHTVFEGFPYDVPAGYDCSNIMYYPVLDVESPVAYMIGASNSENNFIAATRYTAPEQGFNLSKLFFYGTIGSMQNVDFEAEVIQGSDITTGTVIGHGKLRVASEPSDANGNHLGAPRMLEFDKPVYINPNDTFYVALKYPAGEEVFAYIVQKKDEVEQGRFMAYNASTGWYDLGLNMYSAYYSSFGYFMTCIEDEPGEPWIRLLTPDAEGELEVGGKKTVEFEINAESSYFDYDNKAALVIRTNDPTQRIVNYPITLNKNAAPIITLPEGTLTVPEGQTAEMHITVDDVEGDMFTVTLDDPDGIASIGSCALIDKDGNSKPVEVEGNTLWVVDDKTLDMTVKLAPGYGTAGLHSFLIKATTLSSGSRTAEAVYNVEFTNRAPVYGGDETMTVYVGQNTGVIPYETVFTDPDGDEMTFTAELSDNAAASIFTNSTGFILSGLAQGEAELTLTATDANGGTTVQKVKVSVVPATGIGSVETGEGISVSPNPVADRLNVVLGEAADDVNYYVYDNAGSMVATAHAAHKAAGEAQTIDMGACAPGIYRVKVTAGGKQYDASVLKK